MIAHSFPIEIALPTLAAVLLAVGGMLWRVSARLARIEEQILQIHRELRDRHGPRSSQ